MRLLATFPDLGPVDAAQPPIPVCPEPVEQPAALPMADDRADSAGQAPATDEANARPLRTIRVTAKASFPWASVAALVAFAFVAWSLATWNDSRRLARQQAEERLADRAIMAGSEAVLR